MITSKRAFTLVELVVVTTIVAILAATGFIAYTGYLQTGNDTNRITQLSDIRSGLELYVVNNRLPLPVDAIDIQANGETFAYQGDLSKEIIANIGYQGGGQDPEYGTYPIYMVGDNRKDFQLMTFVSEDPSLENSNLTLTPQVYAESPDYEFMYPRTIGKPLGILLDSNSRTPIHLVPAIATLGSYDVILGTDDVVAYLSNTDYINDTFSTIIPNQSCKRILDMGRSKGSDIYTINPTGVQKIRVYCDMETDGGGWTRVVYANKGDSSWNPYTTDLNISDTMKESTFSIKMEYFSGSSTGEDLEYIFYLDGSQVGKIYTDVDSQAWDYTKEGDSDRFDLTIYTREVGESVATECTTVGIYHASGWPWSIASGSGTGCVGYSSGGGFVVTGSSTLNTIYGLNNYSAYTAWDNLEILIR